MSSNVQPDGQIWLDTTWDWTADRNNIFQHELSGDLMIPQMCDLTSSSSRSLRSSDDVTTCESSDDDESHDLETKDVTCGPSVGQARRNYLSVYEAEVSSCLPASPTPAHSVEKTMNDVAMETIYSRVGACSYSLYPSGFRRRALVLAWLSERCQEFLCQRETFHLAVDYLDRYIGITWREHIDDLPLVGAASLLIAIKVEDSNHSGVHQLLCRTAEVSKSVAKIFDYEVAILQAINWRLYPVTCDTWLAHFMQRTCQDINDVTSQYSVMETKLSQHAFINTSRLINLCLLDSRSIEFDYKLITATALCHFADVTVATAVSGFTVQDLHACIRWMHPFVMSMRQFGPCHLETHTKTGAHEAHTVHCHDLDNDLLDWFLSSKCPAFSHQLSYVDMSSQVSDYLLSENVSSSPMD